MVNTVSLLGLAHSARRLLLISAGYLYCLLLLNKGDPHAPTPCINPGNFGPAHIFRLFFDAASALYPIPVHFDCLWTCTNCSDASCARMGTTRLEILLSQAVLMRNVPPLVHTQSCSWQPAYVWSFLLSGSLSPPTAIPKFQILDPGE